MARTFRRQRSLHPIAELNVTNLIDLGFTLLIIFMIATPLISQEQSIHINLPVESTRPQPRDKEAKFQPIAIDRQGRYYFGNELVTIDQLSKKLDVIAAMAKPPVLDIRADLTLQYQQVIQLMDIIKKHNLSRISLDTQTGK
ncbi:MAG TPA: biopolymer transporter ExbD [Opitutaceae bacterium]|nr:biopolymer transporter ExbD [Opitutaceae bacterium]